MPAYPNTLIYGRTADGENVPVLVEADGTVVTSGGGGGGTPGGSDTQLQYNNAGAFGGVPATWTAVGTKLELTGGFEVTGGAGSYAGFPAALVINTDTGLNWQLVITDPGAPDAFGIYSFSGGAFGFQSEDYATTGTSLTFGPNGMLVESNSRGTGAIAGKVLFAGRNTSGSGAAGALGLNNRLGTTRYVWADATNTLRVGSAMPTENGSVSDTSGATLVALAGTVARGSTIVGNSTPAWSALAIGAAGTVLTSNGTDVSWQAPAAGITIGSTGIASGTSGRVLYDNAGVVGEATVTGTLGSVVLSTGPTLTAPVGITGVVGSSALTITGATQTASFPTLDITQTWNNAGVTFTGKQTTITDTASAASSLIENWKVGSVSKFSIRKDGAIDATGGNIYGSGGYGSGAYLNLGATNNNNAGFGVGSGIRWHFSTNQTGPNTNGLFIGATMSFGWTNSSLDATTTADTVLFRDSAGVLAQRNSTNAQTLRIYNTYTNSSTGEWATFNWASNVLHIGATNNGTGTARVMQLDYGGTTTAAISIPITSGAVTFGGGIMLSASDVATDTTTGTKIGTATSQKLGFWNATPVVQPTTAVTAAAFVANTSGIVDDTATFGGYTLGQIVAALKSIGALA